MVHPTRSINCRICNDPLPPQRSTDQQLCWRWSCRQRYQLLQQRGLLCEVCHHPLPTPAKFPRICGNAACQRAALAQQTHAYLLQRAAQEKLLYEQAGQLRNQVLQAFGVRRAQSFTVRVIPNVYRPVMRLSRLRRQQFRAHLEALLEQLDSAPPAPAVPEVVTVSPQLQTASQHVCACCQGFCCLGGLHSHAYLKVETLQRYMAAHPRLSRRQVLREYLRHIGTYTYTDSCVYHQADGCSLPAELRADICGRFYCGELQKFREEALATGVVRGFFAAVADGELQRAALVHEQHMLLLPTAAGVVDA